MQKSQITPERIPLDVREHLMRGQQEAAIALLVSNYAFEKAEASQLIDDYREALRERKIALDIQIMNEQQEKEAREQYHVYWVWGTRIALLVGAIVLIFLLADNIK